MGPALIRISHNMWSSVVLLEFDDVVLSLDEQDDIALNNLIPIAYSGQISGDTNMGPALIRIWNNIAQAFFNTLISINASALPRLHQYTW
jgi:hypothetical protein